MIPLISLFVGFCLFQGTYHGPFFCSVLFFSLVVFSLSGFFNAGASETQRCSFIQGFCYKNKGRFAKNKGQGGIIKFKNKHTTTASTADTDTQRSGSYNNCSNIKVTYNLLLTSNYHNTRLSACKVPVLHQGTPSPSLRTILCKIPGISKIYSKLPMIIT